VPAVLLAGLPGTGKSTLAAGLAQHFSGHVLNKDVIRQAIFGPSHVAYSAQQDDLVHTFMVEAAHSLWHTHPALWVFFDGRTYSRAIHRAAVPPHFTLLCTASEAQIRQRLQAPHPAANRNWQLYEKVRRHFEPITEPHCIIDTDQPYAACLAKAITYLEAAQDT
jgi:predicted kinase